MEHEPTTHPHGGDHIVPVSHYVAVFLALMVLTGATVWVSKIDLGVANTPVAMAIAIFKALLVILIFMHVKYSPKIVGLSVIAAFFWLFHMIAGTLADIWTRGWLGVPGS